MSKENNNHLEKDKKNQSDNAFTQFIERMKKDKMFAGYVYGGLVIIIALVVIIICVAVSKGKGTDQVDETREVQVEQVEQSEEETVSEDETPAEPAFVDDGSLQENAYDEVNQVVNSYFTALAAGDRNAVSQLKSDTNEEELIKIEKKSAYIEAFENITVYTKLGLADNSYITFVYYDINFKDVDTLAPGLTTLYICPSDDGSLHIYDDDLDEETSNRIKEAAGEADVVDLFNRVEVAYNEAVEADANLKKFMDELPTKLDTEVAAALAEQEAGEAAAEEAANVEEPTAEQPVQTTETVVTTDTVNVRSSDSENADKLGKLDVGTQVTRYEARENGWSRIDYNGQEGYVKSEYLSVVSAEQQTTEENTEEQQETATEDASSEQSQGTVTIKETANVRKSAGEGAEKIGVAYQGEHYELLMKQADGWSKIKFGDQIGFVKNDFLEF
ncbi:MAG: SH3 domain-containing protein [Butyrivibrio sp.]|nr:SH3 domain-containing protein [Butyrivibrio sp.]